MAVLRVAQDGSAKYKDVQAAIDAVPVGNKQRVVIEVMPGVYRQPVYIPKTKNLITLRGLRAEETVLTWDNTANKPIRHHQQDSVTLVHNDFHGKSGERQICQNSVLTPSKEDPLLQFRCLPVFEIYTIFESASRKKTNLWTEAES